MREAAAQMEERQGHRRWLPSWTLAARAGAGPEVVMTPVVVLGVPAATASATTCVCAAAAHGRVRAAAAKMIAATTITLHCVDPGARSRILPGLRFGRSRDRKRRGGLVRESRRAPRRVPFPDLRRSVPLSITTGVAVVLGLGIGACPCAGLAGCPLDVVGFH